MRTSKISLLGLYDYDKTILDGLMLPEGLDGAVLKDNLLMETAEMEILYPAPDFLKAAIARWSNLRLDAWTKLYNTTKLEYNPIWNKDGRVTESRHASASGSGNSHTSSSLNDSTTESGKAFNSNDYTDRSKVTGANSSEGSGTSTSSSSEDETYERTETGNIGVTTTQQMIKEEREVSNYSVENVIIAEFKQRFCIAVY